MTNWKFGIVVKSAQLRKSVRGMKRSSSRLVQFVHPNWAQFISEALALCVNNGCVAGVAYANGSCILVAVVRVLIVFGILIERDQFTAIVDCNQVHNKGRKTNRLHFKFLLVSFGTSKF